MIAIHTSGLLKDCTLPDFYACQRMQTRLSAPLDARLSN
jgi:hypothetical protein